MSKKENHQPCPMIADKRSIAINPLATDPANTKNAKSFRFSLSFLFLLSISRPPEGHPRTPETLRTLRASILVDRAGFEPAAFRSPEENIPPCEPDVLRPRQPTTAQHTRLNYRPNPTSARPRNHLKDFRHRQDLTNPENVNTRQSPARKTNGPVAQHG